MNVMKNLLQTITVIAGTLLTGSAPAWATPYTYSFGDEYWLKAGTAFNTVFAGATGNAPTQGLYQQTTTGPSPVITKLSTTSYTTTGNNRFNTTPILGEFTENGGNSALAVNGWTSFTFNSGANGVSSFQINKVQSSPAAVSIQYLTGATVNSTTGVFSGTVSAFNLTSIDLFTAALGTATSYIVEGLLGGVVKYSEQICNNGNQYAVAPVSGSCGAYNQTATVPFNWSNIDTFEFGFINQGTGLFQTGWPNNGTLNMDNIVIDPAIKAAPEPTSLAVLGLAMTALGLIRRR